MDSEAELERKIQAETWTLLLSVDEDACKASLMKEHGNYIFFSDELLVSVAIVWSVLQLFGESDLYGVEKLLVIQSLCLVVVAISHFFIDKGIQGVPYGDSKIKQACAYSLIRM